MKERAITSENLGEHEDVRIFRDERTGLHAVIAIHNRALGPAAGATRYAEYRSEKDAIADALRLSRGMTYKAAMAGMLFGGGKAVILKQKDKPKSKALLHAYGKIIQSLGGIFYTGQDVGMTAEDVRIIAQKTKFVIGKKPGSNNPSYWTAVGIKEAMRAALNAVYGTPILKGKTVAIKGVGNVGSDLARLLHKEGVRLIIADKDNAKAEKLAESLPGTKVLDASRIHLQKADVFSPCAMSHDLNPESIEKLSCRIVCGGANNQLSCLEAGRLLHKKRILYIPDYIANAGGMINVLAELDKGGYDQQMVTSRVKRIYRTANTIIRESERRRKPTNLIADELAERIIQRKNRKNA